MAKEGRRTFTTAQKQAILERYNEAKKTQRGREVLAKEKISPSMIANWGRSLASTSSRRTAAPNRSSHSSRQASRSQVVNQLLSQRAELVMKIGRIHALLNEVLEAVLKP